MNDSSETKEPIITKIQNELKAPKNQYNSFGKYNYRNAEDIEQALKPLLKKYNATLIIDEDVRMVGDRTYFVETAKYKDSEQALQVSGWAREPESKKGMDESQISGATSSYATKYALSKLFLIDDTKDADKLNQGNEYSQKPVTSAAVKKLSKNELDMYITTYKGQEMLLGQIWDLAIKGDAEARAWWRMQAKHATTEVGTAVTQYQAYRQGRK